MRSAPGGSRGQKGPSMAGAAPRYSTTQTRPASEYPRDGREARGAWNHPRLNSLHRDLVEAERQIRSVRALINYPELAGPLDNVVAPQRRLDALVKRRDFLYREIEDTQARLLMRREARR